MAEKILVVDDEVSLQETLTYKLEKEGYQVEVAGDGVSVSVNGVNSLCGIFKVQGCQ